MKYVTYFADGCENAGVLTGGKIVAVNDILRSAGLAPADGMAALIRRIAGDPATELALRTADIGKFPVLPLTGAKILAPISFPARNIFCLGKNYAKHATEVRDTRLSGTGIPMNPIFFSKTAWPALPDGGVIEFSPSLTKAVDYEAELAVIIGKEGRDIRPEEAEDHIFGYTILNDVSARDLQARHEQWFKGKNLDTFCPMGPVIVDKSEISFPVELDISCRVNGELRQNDNTRNLIFDLSTIICTLSAGLTLFPGDIISTGTPSGVGAGFDPPRYLRAGDTVECTIEKIGTLRSKVSER